MVTDFRTEAQRLEQALDAVEARLDALEPGADADVVARGLRTAVCAFDAALKEAAAS